MPKRIFLVSSSSPAKICLASLPSISCFVVFASQIFLASLPNISGLVNHACQVFLVSPRLRWRSTFWCRCQVFFISSFPVRLPGFLGVAASFFGFVVCSCRVAYPNPGASIPKRTMLRLSRLGAWSVSNPEASMPKRTMLRLSRLGAWSVPQSRCQQTRNPDIQACGSWAKPFR